jgi:mono/diheme cytochrome c family protein
VSGLLSKHLGLAVLLASGLSAQSGPHSRQPAPDAGGYPAPTPELERGRTVYVLSACHFCHGVDLTRAVMGAADLMHSPMVAADLDGNVIGAIVRACRPDLQTAMPRYQDLTDDEIRDLARYIHYLRQVGRYKELSSMPDDEPGDRRAGAEYFTANCVDCHSRTGDLSGMAKKYTRSALRARLLRPGADSMLPSGTNRVDEGRRQHLKLLERYADSDVRNLLDFLRDPQ